MKLYECLSVGPGLTAIVGGGGKTTLMDRLARELRALGTVIICTSTKIRRPAELPVLETPDPEQVRAALAAHRVICLGTPWPGGKLAAPALPFEELTALADYVLAEADGSKGLPVKAHAPWEPVIPPNAARTVLVVGADCFGRPVNAVCHRPERFAELAQIDVTAPVTPGAVAAVIRKEDYGNIIYVNKIESERDLENGRALAALLPLPVAAGSLWREEWQCLS